MSAPEDNVPRQEKRKGKSSNVWQRQHGGVKKRIARGKVKLRDSNLHFLKLCCFREEGAGVENRVFIGFSSRDSLENFPGEGRTGGFWTNTQQKYYIIAKIILRLTALLLLIMWAQ